MTNKNTLDKIFDESKSVADYSRGYTKHLISLLNNLDHDKVELIVGELYNNAKNNKDIYVLGNGGSASTATHYVCDFNKGAKVRNGEYIKDPVFRMHSLSDNLSTFTALGNDDGYDTVFSRQLENYLRPGDIVLSISASGNSPNLVKAVEYSKKVPEVKTISLLGFDGGKLKDMSDISLVVSTNKGEYGPVEDIHLVLDHIMSTYMFRALEAGQWDYLNSISKK